MKPTRRALRGGSMDQRLARAGEWCGAGTWTSGWRLGECATCVPTILTRAPLGILEFHDSLVSIPPNAFPAPRTDTRLVFQSLSKSITKIHWSFLGHVKMCHQITTNVKFCSLSATPTVSDQERCSSWSRSKHTKTFNSPFTVL